MRLTTTGATSLLLALGCLLASISTAEQQAAGNLRMRGATRQMTEGTGISASSSEEQQHTTIITDGSQYSHSLADTRRGDPNTALPTQSDPPKRVAEDRKVVDEVTGLGDWFTPVGMSGFIAGNFLSTVGAGQFPQCQW